MQDLRITLIQANQVWENKQANFANYTKLLKDVDSTDLVLLPEMFQTAFSMNAPELAESMDDSSMNWLKSLAFEKNAAVYTSLIIGENGEYFNRGVFVRPSGRVEYYDKRYRFAMAGEDRCFSAGEKETIVELHDWKINLQICYDLRFPENCRNEQVDGVPKYDILVYVANWPERRISHWSALLRARAIENQCYVVGLNRVGDDATGLHYNGASAVFNALGEEISNLRENEESVQQIVLSKDALNEVRERLPFLKDRSCRLF